MDEIHFASYQEKWHWKYTAMTEIVNRFNIETNGRFITYAFVKKNTNRYFKKHLGFIFIKDVVHIIDHKKLLVFRIKCGL